MSVLIVNVSKQKHVYGDRGLKRWSALKHTYLMTPTHFLYKKYRVQKNIALRYVHGSIGNLVQERAVVNIVQQPSKLYVSNVGIGTREKKLYPSGVTIETHLNDEQD